MAGLADSLHDSACAQALSDAALIAAMLRFEAALAIPLVRELTARVETQFVALHPGATRWVHYGATSEDDARRSPGSRPRAA